MNNASKAGTVLITVLILALVGVAGYWLLSASGRLLADWFPEVDRDVLLASATAIVCALLLARGPARGSSSRARHDKALLYEHALRECGRHPDPELERRLVLYASRTVLARYLDLRGQEDPSGPSFRRALHRLVSEMRSDLGHRDGLPLPAEVMDLLARPRGAEAATPLGG